MTIMQSEDVPSMADTDDMINVAQSELEQLVGENTPSICKAKQTVICKDGSQSHCTCMQDGLVTQAAETGVPMDNLNALADDNVAEDREEGEDGGKGRFAVDDQEGNVVDLEPIGQVAYALSAGIGVCNDYDFMSAVDEFLVLFRRHDRLPGRGRLRLRVGTCDSPLLLQDMRRRLTTSGRCSYRAGDRSCR